MIMIERAEHVSRITTGASLMANIGGAILATLGFLGTNATGIGALLGILTFWVNIWFQIKRLKLEKIRIEQEDD